MKGVGQNRGQVPTLGIRRGLMCQELTPDPYVLVLFLFV